MCVCVCVCEWVGVGVYGCAFVCVCTYMQACVGMHIYHVPLCVHMYVHVCTYNRYSCVLLNVVTCQFLMKVHPHIRIYLHT